MFNIFKKKKSPVTSAGIFPFTTDIHSHILPGIDDGSPDIATSLQLVKGLYDLGIRKCIATPHIIGDLYRNTPETIQEALALTREAVSDAGIEMELDAAAEYMLDDYFMNLLQHKIPLLTLYKNYLLTEFSYSQRPHNIEEMAFGMITGGYRPVLAHPERYFYLHENFKEFHYLKELGFHLQVNLLSLTGYYGKGVARAARYILQNDLALLVGTDLHHERHMAALKNPENLAIFNRYLGDKRFNHFEIPE